MNNFRSEVQLNDLIIADPYYSRTLNIHRFSKHPDVSKLTNLVWKQCIGEPEATALKKGGVKPKATRRQQLEILLLNLFEAWDRDPELSIAVDMNNTAWTASSRYNWFGLSRAAPKLVHSLHDGGFIAFAAGSYSGPRASTNRTTRIRAAESLCRLFRQVKFGQQHILIHPKKESVVMRGLEKSQRNLEYVDTPDSVKMRAELERYNWLLQRTFIDIPDLEQPWIDRPIEEGPRTGQMARLAIGGFDHHVVRIFNRNDWRCGGRFFGGWWQNCGSELRQRIHINDQPTVEVDYRALHVAILAAKHGVQLESDPYVLEDGLIKDMDPAKQRKLVKSLVLMALNASSRNKACSAFRNDAPTGSQEKSMKNAELFKVLDAFVEKHPFLRDDICADRGIYLMNIDSIMANMLIRAFTRIEIPALCVHDSFIINYAYAKRLKAGMKASALRVLGQFVEMSHNIRGLDEVRELTPDREDDYLEVRHIPRSPGYLGRQRRFQERLELLDSLVL
ncbi:hypothetical protein [Leisingera sp. NJS204]|uniref:hypothetical protein n=1 Tax=Leisingera sp. NJS204 TaxID=2508307 RepID=UPI001011F43E|nr:hypothetical protein [Leisingera sp. NJS204]QAX30614.1 hypothetical protein ETW24_15195 [Leisingera sp. NJS204]